MAISSRLVGIATAVFLLPMCVLAADDKKPDLKPLADAVRVVVQKYYPKVKVEIAHDPLYDVDQIVVSFNTRKYWIHNPALGGHWQDAHEEVGPQREGVYATLKLMDGQYGGQAGLPADRDKLYFELRVMAPYSRKLDKHLYVHFKFANDASKEFKADVNKLVNDFEKYVPAAK